MVIVIIAVYASTSSSSSLRGNTALFFFQIDQDYVGTPPPLEVSITNINDNIDQAFLTDLVSFCRVHGRVTYANDAMVRLVIVVCAAAPSGLYKL